jgi:tetratricopeptide (TPR) repeat protein
MSLKNLSLAIGVVAISTTAFGQKKNETTASMERIAAVSAFATDDYESAKRKYLSAKEYIDLAAANEETKNNQKTIWLKADIYSGIAALGMKTMDAEMLTLVGEDVMTNAATDLKKAFKMGNKFQDDIKMTADRNRSLMYEVANVLYTAENFSAAGEAYLNQANFWDCIDLLDTTALFNAALCFDKTAQYEKAAGIYIRLGEVGYRGTECIVLASRAYRNAGKKEESAKLISDARAKNPTDRELLFEVVNTSIDEGKNAEAEEALAAAIAADPNNKKLHYTIGTIMIDLGKNEEAETALNRALEIDPDYVDAQYNLGAHLVTWATTLRTEASKLGPNENAKYDELSKKSNDIYRRALIPLEKYITAFPEDKNVLTILFQLHRNIGNSERASEYKKRVDALK